MEDLGSVSEVPSPASLPSEERRQVLPQQAVLQLQKDEEWKTPGCLSSPVSHLQGSISSSP